VLKPYRTVFGTIVVLAMASGLTRAVVEFGTAGLIAYGKLLVGPALFIAYFLWTCPPSFFTRPRDAAASSRGNVRILVDVAIVVIAVVAMVAAVLGVGWLVER
jgi:hypothetical protein